VTQQLRKNSAFSAAAKRLARDTRGNTFFLVAAAMLPLVGVIGSGVDIGRAYMADLRLQQACDAGVLAGRRVMTGGTYTTANMAEASKMFNFNFSTDTYGATNIAFSSVQDGPSNVVGTASAKLPTALMKVFGQNEFNLSVTCTAKLEISNVDVMLVLDVTGSMGSTNSGDSITRLQALKNATMNFFDTLTSAQVGDGRIRFGVVPYNHNVNVGAIIAAKNPNWLADEVTLPSRSPVYRTEWGAGTTTYGTPYDGTPWVHSSWANNGGTIGGKNSTTCPQTTPPANTAPVAVGSPSQTQTGQYVDGNGNLVTTYNNNQNYEYYTYRYVWSGGQCRRQRQTMRFTRTTPSTVTQPPVQVFDRYRYEDRVFDVTNAKLGGSITYDVGDNGTNFSTTWNGCIIERGTEPFAANQSPPATAYDMDIDLVPSLANEDTQWWMQLGHLAFPRDTKGPQETSTDRSSWGQNQCPVAAMNLTTMTSTDRSSFQTYINSLTANGNTYHDAGMTWGARLLSPTGIFSAENSTAPNGRPIQRHLIFMTDGEMVTGTGNLSFQGNEFTMERVGSTSNSDGNSRHTNRFLHLCSAMKAKNVTLWTIDFDTTQTPSLVTCASGTDKAFTAANASQLNTQFQVIARQIARLRIHQ
jgi:Flp pilus assembly protein TadG